MLKSLFSPAPEANFTALVAKGAMVIDVRSPSEFASGHVANSTNIPLDQLNGHTKQLKSKAVPIITVCRSGNRSAMAQSMLNQAGLEVYNGGAWHSFQNKIS